MRTFPLAAVLTLVFLANFLTAQDRKGARERIMREAQEAQAKAPNPGEMAPDFKLKTLDGKNEESLADLRTDKPVVLLFGSYT